jgi:outer membrane lipoprotein-sorting protein
MGIVFPADFRLIMHPSMKIRPFPHLLALCAATVFLSAPIRADLPDPATKDKVPPIAYVQGMIWKRLDLADFTLTGTVRSDKDKSKKSYPIILRTKGHEMVYEFQDQPLQIRVQLNPGVFTVQKRASSSAPWADVTSAELAGTILNTDITYQDLDIDFINWDDIAPLGTDSIKTLDAYVFEAKPGSTDRSRFSSVRFWVSKQYWAFLRVDGINGKGQTVKRVEVQNVMQIGKYYVFKEMKVANMLPDKDDIASSTTYIDITDGKEGSGLSD